MKHENTAKRLALAIAEKNITQQTLSDISGVSKASISQYIHGRNIPNSHSARAMSAVLGVTPEWLMGFGDDNIEKHLDPTYFVINELWKELTTEQRKTLTQTAMMFADLNRSHQSDDEIVPSDK